jgi:pilus assembly protein CpaC
MIRLNVNDKTMPGGYLMQTIDNTDGVRTPQRRSILAAVSRHTGLTLGLGLAIALLPAAYAQTAPAPMEAAPSCSGGLPQPVLVRMTAGKSTLIDLPEAIARRTVGDPGVIDSRMVSPQVLYLASARIGTTNVILQGVSGRCVLLDVVVGIDTDAVQSKFTELMPEEKGLRVSAAGDSIVLIGVVSDAVAVDKAVAIANAYVRTMNAPGAVRMGDGGASGGGGGGPQLSNQTAVGGAAPQSARIVNLLSISSPQQVMLEVKVAEVSKSMLEKLGASLGVNRSGSWTYSFLSNFFSGSSGGSLGAINALTGNQWAIEAEKSDGLVRILAEPNVMAISGQEGSFLAGGRILIPVAQGGTSQGITLEEREFGVGLKFTPTVLADGRINLRVAPEVSELSRSGASVSTGLISSSVLPLITTRRASTTVQLFDGQSFVIGGLMKSSGSSTLRALPVLGELPILGALFRSTEFQNEKTELVFVVTPRLVKPLPPDYTLPTDRIGDARRLPLVTGGRLDSEGRAPSASGVAPSGFQIK